jgi:hypothetical protein
MGLTNLEKRSSCRPSGNSIRQIEEEMDPKGDFPGDSCHTSRDAAEIAAFSQAGQVLSQRRKNGPGRLSGHSGEAYLELLIPIPDHQ